MPAHPPAGAFSLSPSDSNPKKRQRVEDNATSPDATAEVSLIPYAIRILLILLGSSLARSTRPE